MSLDCFAIGGVYSKSDTVEPASTNRRAHLFDLKAKRLGDAEVAVHLDVARCCQDLFVDVVSNALCHAIELDGFLASPFRASIALEMRLNR